MRGKPEGTLPPWQCSPFLGSCPGTEVAAEEDPLEGGEKRSGGREGGGLFRGRGDGKCRHLPQY